MSLLLILAAVLVLASFIELLNQFAGEFLTEWFDDAQLKQSLTRAEKDLVDAKKKSETLTGALNGVRDELARARGAITDVDRAIAERKTALPVLVLRASVRGRTPRRYRAPIKRAFPESDTSSIAQLWRHAVLLEVSADSPAAAMAEARAQYPREQGYTLGSFAEATVMRTVTEVAA